MIYFQSCAAAASFFYAQLVPLYGQLAILIVLAVVGTAAYIWVEFNIRRNAISGKTNADSESSIDNTE